MRTAASNYVAKVGRLLNRSEPLLPLNANQKLRSRPRIPRLTYGQVATYTWILLSLILAVSGYSMCRASSTRISMICDDKACEFERYNAGKTSPTERISFPRENLISAIATRTKNGEAVDFGTVRRRRQRVLGHSFIVKYKVAAVPSKHEDGAEKAEEPTWVEHDILFTRHNIGRKRTRLQVGAINSYIRGDVNALDVQELKAWNAIGVLMMLFGFFAGSFGAMIGDLTGASARKRERKAR